MCPPSSAGARLNRLIIALTLVALSGCATWNPRREAPLDTRPLSATAPKAKTIAHRMEKHGDVRIDEYYWLREREHPDVRAYLDAERAYADAVLGPMKAIREKLLQEMKVRYVPDDSSAPEPDGEYLYYTRMVAGKDHPVHCRRRKTAGAPEEVLVDGNALAAGKRYVQLATVLPSPDHRRIAYLVDTEGRYHYTVHFKDLASGAVLAETIPDTGGSLAWALDSRTVFYNTKDPKTLRADKIWRRRLGDPRAALVYHEPDEAFSVFVTAGLSRRVVHIHSSSTLSDEVRFVDAARPEDPPVLFEPRARGLEYTVVDGEDRHYVLTNDQAKDFRVMEAPLGRTGRAHWKEVIPHRPGVLRERLVVFRTHLVLTERNQGLTQIRIIDRKSGRHRLVRFPDPVYVVQITGNREYGSPQVRFVYQSMSRPPSVYDEELATGSRVLRKQERVPGGFRADDYESKRLFATAPDGTRIPISIAYRKDRFRSGRSPALVYGYGAYGYSTSAWFVRDNVSLLDRGFVEARIHVRGGQEMGRSWYEGGRQLQKRNTFTDFIAGTEALIAQGYAARGHVHAMGVSAGGLLVGAVTNLRPDLYRGIVAGVPFVDVVTTMLDPDLPLTTNEYDEWGNPNDPTFYRYIRSYSPYDNVEPRRYPHLFVWTARRDTQVQYWEPAKWVAKLRRNDLGKSLILLHVEKDASHGGRPGRFARLDLTARWMSFLLGLEGIFE